MWSRTVQLLAAALLFIAAAPPPHTRARAVRQSPRTAASKAQKNIEPPPLPCGDYFSFQVLLDQQGFSPGAIDGKPGDNFAHAIAALQAARQLQPTGQADCDTWHALGGDRADALIATYTVTDDDINDEFQKEIPRQLPEQAKLPALGYRSPLEKLAERFHATPALLKYMNPNVALEPGHAISVPNARPFDPNAKPVSDPVAQELTIQVTKSDSALRVTRPDGSLVFFAPVTTGSEHDPLPIGDWKVTGVQWFPVFHYNPDLFWDAKATDDRATLKPGPNNPVGVVWIGISKEHYGLHGTPEPENIGHTQSHGCVRMTNWDAARVAAFVRPGTPVLFR